MIENVGFTINRKKQHLSKTAILIWDIGLRPLFPVLHKMVNNIEKKYIKEIKHEWIKTFMLFFEPIVGLDEYLIETEGSAFNCFIIKK